MNLVKVKEVVKYGGHSVSANGSVNLTFKAGYSELTNTIKSLQMLNNDVSVKVKLPGQQPFKLGSFRVKQVTIDDDGESTIKLNGISSYIELDNLTLLPLNDSDTKEFQVLFEAEVEEEDTDEEGGE